jgi:hypothetical protein
MLPHQPMMGQATFLESKQDAKPDHEEESKGDADENTGNIEARWVNSNWFRSQSLPTVRTELCGSGPEMCVFCRQTRMFFR